MTVLCTICEKELPIEFTAETVSDHWVFDFDGELDYIELAHRDCAINDESQNDYWNTDLPEQTDEEFEARKQRQGRA